MEQMKMGGNEHYEEELRNLQRCIPDLTISDESLYIWCFNLYSDFHTTVGTTYPGFEKEWPQIMDLIKEHRPKLFEKMTDNILWMGYPKRS